MPPTASTSLTLVADAKASPWSFRRSAALYALPLGRLRRTSPRLDSPESEGESRKATAGVRAGKVESARRPSWLAATQPPHSRGKLAVLDHLELNDVLSALTDFQC